MTVLVTADPAQKAAAARDMAEGWLTGAIAAIGNAVPPERPARPGRPELHPPRDMPRRGRGVGPAARVALLHALAHIELNAVDLACDVMARFAGDGLPRAFFDDWARVADEEATHFLLLSGRLSAFGAAYGDLPAHDGLWQAAEQTAHDLLARLAVVPLVLEARGLDVTPAMIANLTRAGDTESAAVLGRIYDDEVGHVAIGKRWFDHLCCQRGLDAAPAWRALVQKHFRGAVKPPFNHEARARAGLTTAFYAPQSGR